MDFLLLILGGLCLLVGLAGAVLPLPGPALSFAGLIMIHFSDYADFSHLHAIYVRGADGCYCRAGLLHSDLGHETIWRNPQRYHRGHCRRTGGNFHHSGHWPVSGYLSWGTGGRTHWRHAS